MQDQKAQMQMQRDMEKAIELFCCKTKLKADDEREDTIQFIVYKLEDRDKLARTMAFNTPATVLTPPPKEAEQALSNYIADKYRPARRKRAVKEIECASVV